MRSQWEDATKNANEIIQELKAKLMKSEKVQNNLETELKTVTDELQKKIQDNFELKNEFLNFKESHNDMKCKMEFVIMNQGNSVSDLTKELEATKTALCNTENFTQEFNKQNQQLQDQNEILKNKVFCLEQQCDTLNEINTTKDVIIKSFKLELENIKANKVADNLQQEQIKNNMRGEIQQLTNDNNTQQAIIRNLEQTMKTMQDDFQKSCDMNNKKITELTETLNKHKAETTATITQMMNDIVNKNAVNSKLESALDKLKKEIETKSSSEKSVALKLVDTEKTLTEKDNKLMEQIKMNKEYLKEIEQLKEKIQNMDVDIQRKDAHFERPLSPDSGNTQGPVRQGSPIWHFSGQPKRKQLSQEKKTRTPNENVHFVTPDAVRVRTQTRQVPEQDLDFLSDSSMENGFAVDESEISRRFEALSRGEKITAPFRTVPIRRRPHHRPNHGKEVQSQQVTETREPPVMDNSNIHKRMFFRNKRPSSGSLNHSKKSKEDPVI